MKILVSLNGLFAGLQSLIDGLEPEKRIVIATTEKTVKAVAGSSVHVREIGAMALHAVNVARVTAREMIPTLSIMAAKTRGAVTERLGTPSIGEIAVEAATFTTPTTVSMTNQIRLFGRAAAAGKSARLNGKLTCLFSRARGESMCQLVKNYPLHVETLTHSTTERRAHVPHVGR